MNKYFIYYLSLLFCIFFFSCENKGNLRAFKKQNKNGTILVVYPSKIDFGKVNKKRHSQLEFIIELENKGFKPLVINKTDVSCGCISFDIKNKIIPPGKKVNASLVVKTEGNIGYFNKAVFIRSTANNELEIIRVKGEFFD